jgi:GTP-binding protein
MAFVDQAQIEVKAGKGGDGLVSFRHEKFVELGGPYGGDGGHGGSVVIQVDEGLRTLMDFRYNRHFKAKLGGNGGIKGMTGASAPDLIIKVPQGTIISDADTDEVLGDMIDNNQKLVIAKGGRGGRGNMRFATPANPAPEISENGEPGETINLKMELKVLADVGLVGFPSAGKSTLLSVVSGAKPKIAEYHFTTLSPNLGIVQLSNQRSFVIADLPGLIQGASQGVGLGLEFLRHIDRTRVILQLIDMSGTNQLGISAFEAYQQINKELESYDPGLIDRPQIIVATKMDLPDSKDNLAEFQKLIDLPVFEISSVTHQGVDALMDATANLLDENPYKLAEKEDAIVKYGLEEKPKISVEQIEDGFWTVRGKEVEKLYSMTNTTRDQSLLRFAKQLKSMGVDDALKQAGVQPGDEVKIADSNFTFEFVD